jgi:hypothetical protein
MELIKQKKRTRGAKGWRKVKPTTKAQQEALVRGAKWMEEHSEEVAKLVANNWSKIIKNIYGDNFNGKITLDPTSLSCSLGKKVERPTKILLLIDNNIVVLRLNND